MEPNQDDPAVESTLAEYELTEVFVGRDEHATLARRPLQHILVYESGTLFSHVGHIVAC